MMTLVRVLMRALAQLFRSCADFLCLHAEKGGVASPLPEGPRSSLPPADWLRRANPPPPAHWIDLVRKRAPRFLASLPDRRPPAAAGEISQFPGPRTGPLQPAPSGPAASPAELRDRKSGFLETPLPSLRPKSAVEPRPAAARRLRVVTSLEETGSRPAAAAPVAPEVPKTAARGVSVPEPQSPDPAEEPAPLPIPVDPRRPVRRPDPEPIPARFTDLDPVGFPSASRRPDRPVLGFDLPPERRRAPDLAMPARRESLRPSAAPTSPESRWVEFAPPTAHAEAAWPSLPQAPESDVMDDCLALVREQRRLDGLDAEQRGKPWSA